MNHCRGNTSAPARITQKVLYSSHLPFNVILQRASPWLPVTFSMSRVKSIALMMPSPNISFACSRIESPYTPMISINRYLNGSAELGKSVRTGNLLKDVVSAASRPNRSPTFFASSVGNLWLPCRTAATNVGFLPTALATSAIVTPFARRLALIVFRISSFSMFRSLLCMQSRRVPSVGYERVVLEVHDDWRAIHSLSRYRAVTVPVLRVADEEVDDMVSDFVVMRMLNDRFPRSRT